MRKVSIVITRLCGEDHTYLGCNFMGGTGNEYDDISPLEVQRLREACICKCAK